jgi:hypothetical protein
MKLVFRIHAVQRMFERAISDEDVRHVLEHGDTIREYPDDTPYPSRLVLGWRGDRPLHVVAAYNPDSDETIVLTAYEPSAAQWSDDFRSKRT